MNLIAIVTPQSIYHGCSTQKKFREEKFKPMSMKHCVVVTLGNTGKSRMMRIASPWISLWVLLVWTR